MYSTQLAPSEDSASKNLAEATARLRDCDSFPHTLERLSASVAEVNSKLGATVLAEIAEFTQSRNPDVQRDLAGHGPAHTREVLRLLRGSTIGDFDFVRAHAERRAEQRFPLQATLHAYRCGHKIFSRWIRDAALGAVAASAESATQRARSAEQLVTAVADFTIEYTDVISKVAAAAYSSRRRFIADVAGDHRAQLMNILLDGYDESDRRVATILRDAGYIERHQSFCVALAQSIDPAEMINPSRARRLADSIDKILKKSPARRLIDIRDNKVTIIVAEVCRTSGWTVPHTEVARRIATELAVVGNSVLVGISNDMPSTARIPTAYREAELALALASAANRVVQISDVSALGMIMHLAGDQLRRVLPAWTAEFYKADAALKGALVATLRAYADADMNALKTAQELRVHPNTIYSRFQKIRDITGFEARSYHALTDLLIVADCLGQDALAADQ